MKGILEINLNNPLVYKEKVWGDSEEIAKFIGRDVSVFNDEIIGEVFLVSTHPAGQSKFTSGEFLKDEISKEKSAFGKAVNPKGDFPLLLKALSAKEPLSIQTHYRNKTEAWYTLSTGEMLYGLTKKGEKIICTEKGRKELTKLLFKATTVKELSPYFNYVKFKAGESYIIHAGMVHALLKGTVFEPQKNSNLTMRGGDWGRNDPNRELHIKDFFASIYPYKTNPLPVIPQYKTYRKKTKGSNRKNSKHACLFATQDFALDKITLEKGTRMVESFDDRFFIVTVLDGKISVSNGDIKKEIKTGSTFILAAEPNEWVFSGTGNILLTYVPHLMKGVIEPLEKNGYSYKKIAEIGGPTLKENDVYIEMKEKGLL